ncbi:hypothetical protein SAMN02745121_03777 [Nannocystis exedens]|uniref:Cysteine rich repeat-containing protein n=1 Tax=Nannocystis exedens TaxID=54 RepID=A0A1I1ZHW8_9BACT|nr:hypothetical protein [Nannocystis exedens]PCC75017.1 hypothetical protein NAEX_08120 [Nannocystis exedens]SFE29940.1 hypothetical protein SAMN02745121_03777 [Nannocystis exedens]
MKRRASSLALLVVLAAGCSVGSLLDQMDAENQKAIDTVCDCTNVFPDRAACEAQFNSFFSALDRDCLEDALKVDKKASKKSLECLVDRQKDYNDCLEDMLDCNDPNSLQGCQPLLSFDDCPQLPENVQTRVNACGGGGDD